MATKNTDRTGNKMSNSTAKGTERKGKNGKSAPSGRASQGTRNEEKDNTDK